MSDFLRVNTVPRGGADLGTQFSIEKIETFGVSALVALEKHRILRVKIKPLFFGHFSWSSGLNLHIVTEFDEEFA